MFEQLERLNNEKLSDEALRKEAARGKAMTDIAGKIIDNAKLSLEAEKLKLEYMGSDVKLPKMIE
ncbi:hypothetical protein IW492_02820 [Enterococcus sp. BWB1-3]|nr:hypothetical protein [Enterococcus sp. BWB1-3]